MEDIGIKRVYEEPTPEDGVRILVDRIWPRGMTKAKAKIDLWYKEIAPSRNFESNSATIRSTLRTFDMHTEENWNHQR